ncbi:hypothetical protein UA08_04666 [Talaromyces atroroseus]|uniref:Uncharacterized protein n=1 Tax=Talaromyces atroroseus TaxID=1441469 RepID=A0A225AKG6_TALAT|nr:hypothetical protein UA08_04666 [Talaromyces atroroseus]OKL59883.1 hypothetical protein UA08_04666 [Talaromyces atroroseus]
MAQGFSVGQRLSFDGALCTVRYIGEVEGTKGDWLGVEWDDSFRGKHSGEHKGKRYFTCVNNQPTAASFVRPTRPVDKARTFLEALHQKYASEFEEEVAKRKAANGDDFQMNETIQFNGKVVEEVGFEKIRKQLAELQELKVVLLDGLRVVGVLKDNDSDDDKSEYIEELQKIERTCPKITELDLSRNLLYRWQDVQDICKQLAKLKSLKLNRAVSKDRIFGSLIKPHNINIVASPSHFEEPNTAFASSQSGDGNDKPAFQFSRTLKFLDISHNKIDSWLFINALSTMFPGLDSLRISGNPLFERAVAPANVTGLPEKSMTVDEAFMLTLARLADLTSLNYSKISPQDRTNGELYYLSLIGKELSATPASDEAKILATHPRYSSLCEKYSKPTITRITDGSSQGTSIKPGSVAARLVEFNFYQKPSSSSSPSEVISKSFAIPKTFDIYRIKGIASRLFSLPPLRFRLVWETEEWDPVVEFNVLDGEEWDSDYEDEHKSGQTKEVTRADHRVEAMLVKADGSRFVRREVELVDSTRQVGFLFDDNIDQSLHSRSLRGDVFVPRSVAMAEYWKSTPKYWCKHCQIYIRDTAFEKTQHEATGKHQGNLKRFLRDIHRNKEREERETQRTKNEVERLRNLVSGKPATPTATDAPRGPPSAPLSNAPRQANTEDRKKQIAQLAEMGIVVPEEYRKDMALAGAWETVSERRLAPAEDNKEDAKLNVGVRKRRLENDEDEEEAQILAKSTHRGWGNTTLSYPGAANEDDDLDALLSKTTAIKRTDDSKLKSDLIQKTEDETGSKGNVNAEEDLDSATTIKKEDFDTKESPQIPPASGNLDSEGLPSVVFKKRRNKAAKH